MAKYDEQKTQHLTEYREEMREIAKKRYELPKHMVKHKGMRGYKRILEKRKARQLRAAYLVFSRRKDRDQAFQKYAQKQLSLKLSQRGRSWRMQNMSILNSSLHQHEELIKNEFEKRIEEALVKAEEKKQRRKNR